MSRKRLVLTAIVLVLILAIGGILAYFTDVQTKHNIFKTGKVNIKVIEPSFPEPDPEIEYDPGDPTPHIDPPVIPGVPVLPDQEIPKDPQVVNEGDTDVYAFVEVTIPVRNIKVGTATEAAPTQLFTLRHITDATTTPKTTAPGINEGWTLIKQEPETITSTTTSVKYLYAYGSSTELTAIPKPTVSGETITYNQTPALFDTVKFVDITEKGYSEDSEIQGQSFEVEVKGYGIQVDGLSSKVPLTVWNDYVNK